MPAKKPQRYAEKTQVPVANSQNEIRKMLEKYGVVSGFMVGEANGVAKLAFEMNQTRILFSMGIPRAKLGDEKAAQETRRMWRAMVLCIKAKLESVSSGIETFEDAFLAQTVLASGETFGEWVRREENQTRLDSRQMPPLLPGPRT